jgi:uncharacterized protein YkwD
MPFMIFHQSTFTLLAALLITSLFGCMAYTSLSPNTHPLLSHSAVEPQNHASQGDATCTTAQVMSDILSRVNRMRTAGAVCGAVAYPPAAPLRSSTKLQQAAALHSQDMASHNFFSHKSVSNGSNLPERLRAVDYKYQVAGENIGAGPSTAAQMLDIWLASPGHCANLMSANFVELGASCQNSNHSTYKTYWTMKVATPI